MAEPPVGADLLKALDVLGTLPAQIALDLVVLDRIAKLDDLVLGQVLDLGVRVHPGLLEDVPGRRAADAEHVGEADLGPLVEGDVDSGDARHLALPLLVPGVGTDHENGTATADHLALLTHLLDAGADLHQAISFTCSDR